MPEIKPKVLIISSANPCKGPGVIAADAYKGFKKNGYEVDFLTLNKVKEYPEFLYIKSDNTYFVNAVLFAKRKCDQIANWLWAKTHHCLSSPRDNYWFFYRSESNPPVPTSFVLSQIKKNYDLVIIRFWQGLLSFNTVEEIWKKLHCRIVFACVDYSPMSGGCHFTGDCERYKVGCGCCPAFQSSDPNDFTRKNVEYRKRFYEKVKPIVTGNSYMSSFYAQSYLLQDIIPVKTFPVIDTQMFMPYNKVEARDKLGFPRDSFIILFGSQQIENERKGFKYLIESLNIFYNRLSGVERENVMVVAIGDGYEKIKTKILFRSRGLGYVAISELPIIYSMSDVFLCSSVNDAGPMMVNQSLCCGTPVVGFEMGACIDSVKDRGTGYCAKLQDSSDLASGIMSIFKQTPHEKKKMQDTCRLFAATSFSSNAMVDNIITAYRRS